MTDTKPLFGKLGCRVSLLGLLVGAMLSAAGGTYQGVFRNPLADPYVLGVAAGAGFGATLAIVSGVGDGSGFLGSSSFSGLYRSSFSGRINVFYWCCWWPTWVP